MPRRDLQSLRQQWLTAQKFLERTPADAPNRHAAVKIEAEARRQFEQHPEHPDRKAERARRRKKPS